MRTACDVVVWGEAHSLPLTMEAWDALAQEGLDLYRLTVLAVSKGEPMVLTQPQAAHTLAIGMAHAKGTTRQEDVRKLKWEILMTSRAKGVTSLLTAATEYLAEFAAEASTESPPKAQGEAKETPAPNP